MEHDIWIELDEIYAAVFSLKLGVLESFRGRLKISAREREKGSTTGELTVRPLKWLEFTFTFRVTMDGSNESSSSINRQVKVPLLGSVTVLQNVLGAWDGASRES